MAKKSDTGSAGSVAIVGDSSAAIQTALSLARIGVAVNLITGSAALSVDDTDGNSFDGQAVDRRYLWSFLLRAVSHPLITLYSNATVEDIVGEKGNFKVKVLQRPRYVNTKFCTACGRCESECSVKLTSLLGEQKVTHSAIHTPLLGFKSIPSACVIDKNGFAPCRIGCPLGINVQGFISLLSKGKADKALALINESAPLAGVLGRVCRNACEENCNRAEVDAAVSIRSLHRYVADNASGGIRYKRKATARSRQEKIAIVGSGPGGLTAAWELTRRGYSPTVFESHGVIGGMLATGIPRFRLPREVREREIEAIKNLGVDIRTGITVGRDITYGYLKERGYKALFLSIGSQQDNKLDIPGEGLDGVVDCMSLLLALNLKVDTFVGSNVAVIGGGNAAVDAARSVIRSGAEEVTIYYRRTRVEMPANDEEVEEAIKEGVKIEFGVVPVEVLGDGGKVCGIRYQRTRLNDEIAENGRARLEIIEDSDFLRDADHVVVAIGQSPNAAQLNMPGLEIEDGMGVIKVNPLTLETSIRGVFAGGDCITGPNSVVDAMAAGLRAAESIDRYLQGIDLEEGRSLEPSQAAQVELSTIDISPYERAKMPLIRPQKRIKSYEETTTGLSAEAVEKETQRCLNCALCSQCMECTEVCELDAVFHDDNIRNIEVEAQVILKFATDEAEIDQDDKKGIYTIANSFDEIDSQLVEAMALAIETASGIKQSRGRIKVGQVNTEAKVDAVSPQLLSEQLNSGRRVGVFLCRCGGSVSSVINFSSVTKRLSHLPGVTFIKEIAQACTEEGAKQMADQIAEWQVGRLVLAACRCCNSEQVCYSCTDRRQMCQQYLNKEVMLPQGTVVEFCNIREQCAWAHQEDPKGATRKATQIISSAVLRARMESPAAIGEEAILPSVLILGDGRVSSSAAKALASRGYQVTLVVKDELEVEQPKGITVKLWPESIGLYGSPGSYEVILEYGSQSDTVDAGSILVDSDIIDIITGDSLLGRLVSRDKAIGNNGDAGSDLLREVTIGETAGIFLLSRGKKKSIEDKTRIGLAAAARVAAYIEQGSVRPRAMAVVIDKQMCRGCGDCADICPYIEMCDRGDGTTYATIYRTLCLGCGACIAACPTGAITQPWQSDRQMMATLRSMLHTSPVLSEV